MRVSAVVRRQSARAGCYVALVLPTLDVPIKDVFPGYALRQVAAQHAQFDRGHVEPGTSLGRVMGLQALGKVACLMRGGGLIE